MAVPESSHRRIGIAAAITANELRYRAPALEDAAALTSDYGWFAWSPTSTASDDGTTVLKVPDITEGRWLAVTALGLDTDFSAANAAIVKKATATIGFADLDAAATTQTIAVAITAANTRIVGVAMHTYTPFTGGTVSAMVVDIGTTGDVDALVDGANVFDAAVDGQPSTMPAGIAPNKLYATAPTINALFTATGDNVVNCTAGAVTIDILYVELA